MNPQRDQYATRRGEAARCTSAERLAELATDHHEHVRAAVARNPQAPPEALSVLASDDDNAVRWWVAVHPNTPAGALRKLADDPIKQIRYRATNRQEAA